MVIYDLCETYHRSGDFEFKIVLDKTFKNGHDISIKMFDPDNNPMEVNSEVWGRKVNCIFSIDKDISEGVCVLKIELPEGISENVQYWIIK